jgi:hypothetical protein
LQFLGAGVCFDSAAWKATGSSILRGVDDIQQLLDDQVVKTQAMRASPYIGPFEEQVKTWEAKLNQTQVGEAAVHAGSSCLEHRKGPTGKGLVHYTARHIRTGDGICS